MKIRSRDPDILNVNQPSPPYVSPGAQGGGMVKYNTNSNELEVWDGVAWRALFDSQIEISLNPDLRSTIEWARHKQQEERELQELCKKHPGLQEAHDRLQIMRQLVKKDPA